MSLREPLCFRPILHERVWGGERLEGFLHLEDNREGPFGEAWSVVDRLDNSSVVFGGSFEGRRLKGLMMSEREDLLGRSRCGPDGSFPLLIKFIDTSEPLSVQVHPDEVSARTLGCGAEAKNEFWYVLDASQSAEILLGLREDVDAVAFAESASSARVVESMQTFRAEKGQHVYVPAGTLHALGAGLFLVEIQNNADTTYRLYDWDRPGLDGEPRELHVEEALKSINSGTSTQGPVDPEQVREEERGDVNACCALHDGPEFRVEHMTLNEPQEHDTAGLAWIYVVIGGKGEVCVGKGEELKSFVLKRGDSWLLPAALGRYRFRAMDGDLEVLRVQIKPAADAAQDDAS